MKYLNISLSLIFFLLLGCGDDDDVRLTKFVSSTRTLLNAVDSYKKTNSKLPASLAEAVEEFKENISGEILVENWDYVITEENYVLISRIRLKNKIIFARSPDIIKFVDLKD